MFVLPDDFANEDLIGHKDYCDGLVKVIQSVKSKGSFTIGVYGQWGLGKTSFLRQIKDSLDKEQDKEEQDKEEGIITIWFNPWQFVAEEHLIIPFFHTLISNLENIKKESKAEIIKGKLTDFLEKVAHIPISLFYGMEAKFKIPLLLDGKIVGSKVLDDQRKAEEIINDISSQKKVTEAEDAAKKYESTYYRLIQILQEAAVKLDLKIVVFIDDLDRCLPEKAVQLLEGLKVLLDLQNFVFVFGVAQEVIERGIRVRYRELYKIENSEDLPKVEEKYLDKIIQFSFSLPSPDPKELRDNLLIPHLKELNGAEQYVSLIHDVLGSNPRTLKRFLNSISFSSHIAEKKLKDDDDFQTELLIKICLISYLFPALYRELEKHPSLLVRLEGIVHKLDNKKTKQDTDSTEEVIDGVSLKAEKTGLAIDKWLEEESFIKLFQILKLWKITQDYNAPEGLSFKNKETVVKYIRLLAIPMQSEAVSKSNDILIETKHIIGGMKDRMVKIPIGKFPVGNKEIGYKDVVISEPFKIDKYPVTQALYYKVMDENPSFFKGEDLPVENISWFDAIEFCNKLSIRMGLERFYVINGENVDREYEKNGYRLPTEAQWEYVCRANQTDHDSSDLTEIAWYEKNSNHQTQEVGQKRANGFGLYDMLGNVWEWCDDWYGEEYIRGDISGPEIGDKRVIRGGSWTDFSTDIHPSRRLQESPSYHTGVLGMRLVVPE